MKINHKFTLVLLLNLMLSILSTYNAYTQTPDNDPTWILVFEDDFDSTAINTNKWKSMYEWGQKSYEVCRINETNDTTFVDTAMLSYRTLNYENCLLDTAGSGILTLVSKKENPPYYGKCWNTWVNRLDSLGNVQYDEDGNIIKDPVETWHYFNYTTGMINSKATFRYGYFEIKCKLPQPNPPYNGKGLGPNFWLWGNNDSIYWSEIDIFEFDARNNLHTSCVHYQLTNDSNSVHWKDRIGENDPYDSIINFDTYHKFSAEWDIGHIYNRIDNDVRRISNPPAELSAMRIIVDINHPLLWLTGNCCIDTVYTMLPFNYQIDYVKVWQLKQECNTNINVCNFSAQTYNFAVYKNITLGGSGCSSTINNGENVTLRATESITLNEGFVVNANATFQASIVECQEQEVNLPQANKQINIIPPPEYFNDRHLYK